MKESVSSFLSNVLSVILGIAITFAVQGMIDRSRVRKDVRSALKLIRTELQSNQADIAMMADYLDSERAAAKYFLSLDDGWTGASSDSVVISGGILLSAASIALSDDALQLLKMSSLFPKIKDNELSMKVIRAYDACELMASNVNRHISARDSSPKGAVQWLNTLHYDISEYVTNPDDVHDAVEAIDAFLLQ
jgi:hypothetical protein